MSDIAIRVENLSKLYRIGTAGRPRYETLYDKIADAGGRLLDRLRRPLVTRSAIHIPQSEIGNPQSDYIWALKDVSFEVKRGEVVGIIGRNGAGKSTLLKILSRITEPTEGRAYVYGRVGSLLEVGTGFHPELTGRENIYLNGAILGMRKVEIDRKFDEIVTFAEIEKFIDTPVKFYSSGMYVRLAFAVAAHLDPEILLVDEVLAVGDAAFQKKCLGKMGEVAGEGRTVLFVSHNMAAVESLCRRAFLLSQGQVANVGEVHSVVAEYLEMIHNDIKRSQWFGGLWIKGVQLQNTEGEDTDAFGIGEPMRVLIAVNTGGEEIANPEFGIGVNTVYGQRVFTVGTYFSRHRIDRIYGDVVITCEIEPPALAPGEYSIKVALGRGRFEPLEEVEDVARFSVKFTDFFGTGRLPQRNQGNVLVTSRWEISNV